MQNLGTLDNKYIILRETANGPTTRSYLVKNIQDGKHYHIKVLTDNNLNEFPAQEMEMLKKIQNLNNPNIIGFIESGNGPLVLNNQPHQNRPYLVFEYAPNGDLFNYARIRSFGEKYAKLIFQKILNGIRAMHNAGICHRDIKLSNILLNQNFEPKIINFSFACNIENNPTDFVGTLNYMAPEIIREQPYNPVKCDIFSLGQLLFSLVTGILGFNSSRENDPDYTLIRQRNYEEFWNRPVISNLYLSNSFKELFLRMVAYNPNERPTIEEILNSEWMQDIKNLNPEQMENLENEVREEFKNREIQIQANLHAN